MSVGVEAWPKPDWECPGVRLYRGDCLEILPQLPAGCIDAVITDPPYGLGFMGQAWDHGVPGVAFWQVILDACKPGAHLLAFGGTRTFHRLTCAIEDAGWEIRDCLMWVYGSGFPKSLDVSKAIDKAAGAERERIRGVRSGVVGPTYAQDSWSREYKDSVLSSEPKTEAAKQWDGWGTALKPAWEPIILARKPLDGTVVDNVLTHGCGGLNIDGCRVGTGRVTTIHTRSGGDSGCWAGNTATGEHAAHSGRFPANVIHDGSEEVLAEFPQSVAGGDRGLSHAQCGYDGGWGPNRAQPSRGDCGSAARFFYCAKADKKDRGKGNNHPTVKPTDLLRYLCRLIVPPGGVLLDPFLGSGSTGVACADLGCKFVGIEIEQGYFDIAVKRIDQERRQGQLQFTEVAAAEIAGA